MCFERLWVANWVVGPRLLGHMILTGSNWPSPPCLEFFPLIILQGLPLPQKLNFNKHTPLFLLDPSGIVQTRVPPKAHGKKSLLKKKVFAQILVI